MLICGLVGLLGIFLNIPRWFIGSLNKNSVPATRFRRYLVKSARCLGNMGMGLFLIVWMVALPFAFSYAGQYEGIFKGNPVPVDRSEGIRWFLTILATAGFSFFTSVMVATIWVWRVTLKEAQKYKRGPDAEGLAVFC